MYTPKTKWILLQFSLRNSARLSKEPAYNTIIYVSSYVLVPISLRDGARATPNSSNPLIVHATYDAPVRRATSTGQP